MIVELEQLADQVRNLRELGRWYLYGSCLGAPHTASDIDVLVVCVSEQDTLTIRREAASLLYRMPLHLLIMTENEERELDFIQGQGCIEFFEAP